MLAWIIANLFSLERRDRFLIFICGIIADIDGIFIFLNWDIFISIHRKMNSIFCLLLVALVVYILSKQKKKSTSGAMTNYSLHMVTDLFFWKTYLFWPILPDYIIHSYPNYGVEFLLIPIFIFLCIWIIIKKRRTPIEFISEQMDEVFVNLVTLPFTHKCSYCENISFFKCNNCKRYLCKSHIHLGIEDCNSPSKELFKNRFWFYYLMFFMGVAFFVLILGLINSLLFRNFILYMIFFMFGSISFCFSLYISIRINFHKE